MNEKDEKTDLFKKRKKKSTPYYLDEEKKEKFQIICSRLNSNCNKELCLFVNEFIEKHKEVLNARRS